MLVPYKGSQTLEWAAVFRIRILEMKIRKFGSGSFCKLEMVKKVDIFGNYEDINGLKSFSFSSIVNVIKMNLLTLKF